MDIDSAVHMSSICTYLVTTTFVLVTVIKIVYNINVQYEKVANA